MKRDTAVLLASFLFFMFVFQQAFAYRPGGQRSSLAVTTAVTVGVTSAQAIGIDAQRSSMWMCNDSATATVFWSTGTFGPAVMNTAGSLPLPSLSCVVMDNTKFTDSVNMIASVASTPVTILVWD